MKFETPASSREKNWKQLQYCQGFLCVYCRKRSSLCRMCRRLRIGMKQFLPTVHLASALPILQKALSSRTHRSSGQEKEASRRKYCYLSRQRDDSAQLAFCLHQKGPSTVMGSKSNTNGLTWIINQTKLIISANVWKLQQSMSLSDNCHRKNVGLEINHDATKRCVNQQRSCEEAKFPQNGSACSIDFRVGSKNVCDSNLQPSFAETLDSSSWPSSVLIWILAGETFTRPSNNHNHTATSRVEVKGHDFRCPHLLQWWDLNLNLYINRCCSLHRTVRHGNQGYCQKARPQGTASNPKGKIIQLRIAAKAEENLTKDNKNQVDSWIYGLDWPRNKTRPLSEVGPKWLCWWPLQLGPPWLSWAQPHCLAMTCPHHRVPFWNNHIPWWSYTIIYIVLYLQDPRKKMEKIDHQNISKQSQTFIPRMPRALPLLCGKLRTLVEMPALSQKLMLWPKMANNTILGQPCCHIS